MCSEYDFWFKIIMAYGTALIALPFWMECKGFFFFFFALLKHNSCISYCEWSAKSNENDLFNMEILCWGLLCKLAKWCNIRHRSSKVWWDDKTLITQYLFKCKKCGPRGCLTPSLSLFFLFIFFFFFPPYRNSILGINPW